MWPVAGEHRRRGGRVGAHRVLGPQRSRRRRSRDPHPYRGASREARLPATRPRQRHPREPHRPRVQRGVEDIAHDAGVGTVVSAIHNQVTSERRWWQKVQARASDGIILVTSHLQPKLQAEVHRYLPTVVVDPSGSPSYDVPTIGATNWAGGLSATEHLIELGHRRIGIITGPPRLQCSRARLDGYRAALEAAVCSSTTTSSTPATSTTSQASLAALNSLDCPTRRQRCSPPVTRWRSASTKPRGNTVFGCPATSASSASTTCRKRRGRLRHSPPCGSHLRRWAASPHVPYFAWCVANRSRPCESSCQRRSSSARAPPHRAPLNSTYLTRRRATSCTLRDCRPCSALALGRRGGR